MRQCCVSFGGFVSCLFLFLLVWLLVRFLLRLLVLLLSLVRCVVWRLLLVCGGVLLFSCCCFWVCRSCCWFVAWCFLLCWCLFCCPAPLWCLVVRFCPCVGAFPCCACFSLPLFVCSCWLVSVGGSSAFFKNMKN